MQMFQTQAAWYDRLPLNQRLLSSITATAAGTQTALLYTVPADRRAVIHACPIFLDFNGGAVGDVGFGGLQSAPSAGALRDTLMVHGTGASLAETLYRNDMSGLHLLSGDFVHAFVDATGSAVNITVALTLVLTEYEEIT